MKHQNLLLQLIIPWRMTAKTFCSCKYSKHGSIKHLLFLFLTCYEEDNKEGLGQEKIVFTWTYKASMLSERQFVESLSGLQPDMGLRNSMPMHADLHHAQVVGNGHSTKSRDTGRMGTIDPCTDGECGVRPTQDPRSTAFKRNTKFKLHLTFLLENVDIQSRIRS